MAAGDVGVIGQKNVAGFDILPAEMFQLGPDGFCHAADEGGQSETDRNRLRVRGEQPDGEIQRLVDDHVVGGAHQIGLHLFRDGHHAVADDFDQNGIGAGAQFRLRPFVVPGEPRRRRGKGLHPRGVCHAKRFFLRH